MEGGSALERQRALPRGFSLSQLKAEATRLRRLYESLELPLVIGHGDLKPSNLMLCDHADPECAVEGVQCGLDDIVFIDFELAGRHYRGYDLFKLFRTNGEITPENLDAFLTRYLPVYARAADTANAAADNGEPPSPWLNQEPNAIAEEIAAELQEAELEEFTYETLLFEPLSWFEAAVFFVFAMREFPDEAHRWERLAVSRWKCYCASAHLVDASSEGTLELLEARERCARLRERLLSARL